MQHFCLLFRQPHANRVATAVVGRFIASSNGKFFHNRVRPSTVLRAKCRWYVEQGSRAVLLLDPEAEIAEYFGPAGTWDAYLGTRVLPLEDILPALDLTPQAIFAILHQA